MRQKVFVSLLLVLLIIMVSSLSIASAQTSGAIRGTVYKDLDANGVCVGTGDPVQSGIPVEFVSADGNALVLNSGDDGSYGLVAAGLGTWQVTVKPGTGWMVTSEQTRQVTISTTNPAANNVDFCVAQVTASTETAGAVVLPASGALISPSLLIVGVTGLVFLAAGAVLLLKGRRATA
jgi:hypothetical protein